MFGLTRREQRWAAEQKAAETISGVLIAGLNAKAAADNSEALAAIAVRDARIAELEECNVELEDQLHVADRASKADQVIINHLRAELADLREQVPATATERFVQPVPDKCDRIIWRDRYYGLPLTEYAAPVAKQVVMPERKPQRITDEYARGWNAYAAEYARLNAADQEGGV